MRSVPGKLMLAGEYGVLLPEGIALAAAVGSLVRVRAIDGSPGVELHAFGRVWHLPGSREGLAAFVQYALDWLQAHDRPLTRRWRLEVSGAAGDRKLGLGTSAAVTVAVLAAGLDWPVQQVAAAAREVHAMAQDPPGSGYDVTSIAHGGVVAYARASGGVERLTWPGGLWAAALYSGEAASTTAALRRLPATAHLERIDAAAHGLRTAWPQGAAAVLGALLACQSAFDGALADDPALGAAGIDAARAIVASTGCVARTSGAGGGDCLLAFSDDPERLGSCLDGWRARGGIVAAELPIHLAPETP